MVIVGRLYFSDRNFRVTAEEAPTAMLKDQEEASMIDKFITALLGA